MFFSFFFFFNDTATTEIYTLSLHDALPIFQADRALAGDDQGVVVRRHERGATLARQGHTVLQTLLRGRPDLDDLGRSEEHTSELQSRLHLVCRLLLEKKNTTLERAVATAYA